jgi:type VI secretion system protein ImpE
MIAKEFFERGQVIEAQRELSAHLRDHPGDIPERTFLFELLCFSGDYERAEKQLSVLAQRGNDAELGAILYYAALHAEKTRHEMFRKEAFPVASNVRPKQRPGQLNGKPFQTITDADPDIGPRLEVFAAGSYMWMPFEHIASVQVHAPRRLRDMLWASADVRSAAVSGEKELGEVLIPVIYPFSWKHPDPNIWLGRITEWSEDEQGREYPKGQKILVVDGEEIPFLEVRSLEFSTTED